ncbi:hypothetical protein ACFV23_05370 [Streptomyces sp. NPDC059627]
MADSDLFAANPDGIKQGGDITSRITDIVHNYLEQYGNHYIDPNNPSIGEPDDATVAAILRTYSPAYNENVEILRQLIKAILKAAELTTNSGINFNKSQLDALDQINSGNSRRLP